jgi:hypothetical protein
LLLAFTTIVSPCAGRKTVQFLRCGRGTCWGHQIVQFYTIFSEDLHCKGFMFATEQS